MNINEWKEQEVSKVSEMWDNNQTFPNECGFIRGFDCAMNLGLAVKFYHWYDELGCVFYKTPEEGYNHWIENILKIKL